MTSASRSIVLGFTVLLSGCAFEAEDPALGGEPLGEAEGAIVSDNALNFNALNLNALNLNALNFNALNLNALNPQSLAAIQDPGANGALARALLRYAASCALSTSQSFDFTWTDAQGVVHAESYPGLLGVAPAWATGALDITGQRMVSACLAARVNYYEVPVIISARSLREPLKTLCNSQELVDYPDVEGAFWGNLFADQPYLHACYNAATVSNSRAAKRECAAGHPLSGGQTEECGIIRIVGPCADVCQNLNGAGQYYPSCVDLPGQSGTTTKDVITTGLP